MKKQVIELPDAAAFAATMGASSIKRYGAALVVLQQDGFLRWPLAEKVVGLGNLFAIRIMTAGNERFFYCYDDGARVFILCGYTKKSAKIPMRELQRALALKNALPRIGR